MSESETLSGDLTTLIVETDEIAITTTDTLDSPENSDKENGRNGVPQAHEPRSVTTPNRVLPSLNHISPTAPHTARSPDGKRYRQLYEELKKKYLIQQQSVVQLEK